MGKTKIEWTKGDDGESGYTWNPIRGCSRVSEGCRFCYAERVAGRFSGPGLAYEGLASMTASGARWTGEVRLIEEHLNDPLRWKRPRRIFANSMSDLFHESLPDEAIDKVFAVMALAPQHTFQVLTKRAERMRDYLNNRETWMRLHTAVVGRCDRNRLGELVQSGLLLESQQGVEYLNLPLPNVQLGISVEDEPTFKKRWPFLRDTPAAVRWISYEPALGPVDFEECVWPRCVSTREEHDAEHDGGFWCDERSVDWIVVGGESGPGARPFDIQWARDVVAQCKAAGVPVFVKQLGSRPVAFDPEHEWFDGRDFHTGGRTYLKPKLKDKKGGDWDEWPADLRVRQYPAVI